MAKTDTRKLFKRDVLVKLDEQQALELHDEAQERDARADELEAKLKEDVKERKLRIETLRSEAERDRAAATKREHLVAMDCYETAEGFNVVVRRADTDEVVDTYAATAEQQQSFGLDTGGDLPLEPDYSSKDAGESEGDKEPAARGKGKRGRGGKAKKR